VAVEILEQVCLALEEAHKVGVVHRDLKPRNIMIDHQGRVVVMDFGIARSVQATGMTQTGSLLGSPDYMSPEQVKGEHVDSRSDLFALGIVFYKLLTGEVPYKADSSVAAMYMRTQERAKSVRELNPEVPGVIADIISKCLEISPQRRYQSARELLQDLEMWRGGAARSMTVAMRHISLGAQASRRRNAAIAAGAALVVVLVLAIWMLRSRAGPDGTVETPPPPEEVTSLAILPFHNSSGTEELAWLSTGLADMLLTDVGQSAYLRTVSSDRLHQVLGDLGVAGNTTLDAAERQRVAEVSNADTLLWGQFAKLGERIRIDATLEDLEGQRRVPIKAEAATESEVLDMVERLAELVRENLALTSEQVDVLEAQAFKPSSESVAALRFYTSGLGLIREGKNLEAVKQFEASVAEDPDFALAYSKLGEVNFNIGHGKEAEKYSSKAVELSEDLLDQERNQILAANSRITNNLEAGVQAYENLLRYRPNDPDLHFELGLLYEGEGLLDRAQNHYSKVLEMDPQNLSALLRSGRSLAEKGDAQAALEPLNLGLTLAAQTENREAEANILQAIGLAYTNLTQPDEGLRNYEQSLAIKRELGDKRGMAVSLTGISYIQQLKGEWDAARTGYQQVIELRREIGDEQGLGETLMSLGEMERRLGNYDEALTLTRQALRIQVETNDELNQSTSLNNIGAIYYMQGNYDDALVYYQRSLEIRKRLDAPMYLSTTLHNLGETYGIMGRFDEAQDHFLRALELYRDLGDERGIADESGYLSRVFALQGRYGAALESIEQAVESFRRLGDESLWFVEALAWNGQVLNLIGRAESAAPILEEALAMANERGDPWVLTQTLNFEGDRHFFQGDFTAARQEYSKALEVASDSGDPLWELTSKLNLAKVDTETGGARKSLKVLDEAADEARALGLKVLAAECAIRSGEALLAAGEADRGREDLARALQEGEDLVPPDLRARGHYLLAAALSATGDERAADPHATKSAALLAAMLKEPGNETLKQRLDLRPVFEASESVSTPQ
jgi:tetratricopeptide (TPR) repeat protein